MSEKRETKPETGAEAATENKSYKKCEKCYKSPCICKKSNGKPPATSGGPTKDTSSSNTSDNTSRRRV